MSIHLLASSGLSRVSTVLPRSARTCGRASPPCTTKRKSIALCVDSADGERVSGYDRTDLAHDRIGGKPMSPKQLGGISGGLYVYVEDVDEVVQQVVDAGGTIGMPVETMFWGDRFGSVTDPFGHIWQIATRVEEVPPEEMAERAKA